MDVTTEKLEDEKKLAESLMQAIHTSIEAVTTTRLGQLAMKTGRWVHPKELAGMLDGMARNAAQAVLLMLETVEMEERCFLCGKEMVGEGLKTLLDDLVDGK